LLLPKFILHFTVLILHFSFFTLQFAIECTLLTIYGYPHTLAGTGTLSGTGGHKHPRGHK
ncbi:MAG: hypothetical protein KKB76_00430, partial [Candidatus Omnitrophica bacterium]|nr:hypothetical protein [Candidatus Omnitrophota bacterium]